MSRRTARQAVAAAVARRAITPGRAQYWLGEIADGRATLETVDLLAGGLAPAQASSPAPGPDDDYPEYAALWPAEAEAVARIDAAAARHQAEVDAFSDDELFDRLFPKGS